MKKGEFTWKGLSELIGMGAIVATLALVAIEIRQNTAAVRGATLQAVSQQSLELVMVGLDNQLLRSAFAAASYADPETLSSEHREILHWFLSSKLRADENRYRQIQLGTLDASTFGQLSSNGAYRLRFFAYWWATYGEQYSVDFQEVVEREFLPLSQSATEARP